MENDSRTSQKSLQPTVPLCGVYVSSEQIGAGAGIRENYVHHGTQRWILMHIMVFFSS